MTTRGSSQPCYLQDCAPLARPCLWQLFSLHCACAVVCWCARSLSRPIRVLRKPHTWLGRAFKAVVSACYHATLLLWCVAFWDTSIISITSFLVRSPCAFTLACCTIVTYCLYFMHCCYADTFIYRSLHRWLPSGLCQTDCAAAYKPLLSLFTSSPCWLFFEGNIPMFDL